jgi:rRNA maturation RNase YbeY
LSRIDVILSETEAAALLTAEERTLCRSVVREALLLEARRLADLVGVAAGSGAAADAAAPAIIEVGLTLMDEAGVRDLNLRYLGCDKATDVLAFSMIEEDSGGMPPEGEPNREGFAPGAEPVLLGDVVVSVPVVRVQAADWERPFGEELARVVGHGTLHLVGYTDESDEAATQMRVKEDAVLSRLGFRPEPR